MDEAPIVKAKTLRWAKAGDTLGLTDEQLVKFDYIQSLNPRLLQKTFGTAVKFDDVKKPALYVPRTMADVKEKRHAASFGAVPSSGSSAKEEAQLRWVKLAKTLGMSESEIVSYDYLQTINPKIFKKTFGDSRPKLSEVHAPLLFRPRKLSDTKPKVPGLVKKSSKDTFEESPEPLEADVMRAAEGFQKDSDSKESKEDSPEPSTSYLDKKALLPPSSPGKIILAVESKPKGARMSIKDVQDFFRSGENIEQFEKRLSTHTSHSESEPKEIEV